jgi:NAD(P)-dependent dehydrogenase (short-subunit alcohol dehydrogenase family)
VLLTGGSAGIGRATLRRLSAAGAAVVVCARDGDRLAEAVAGLPRVTPVVADTGVAADREHLVARALEEHGRLDALVNDAALGWAGLVEDMPAEAVEQEVAVNLTGVVDLTRRALPHLLTAARERGRADVVVVASVAGWSQVPPLTVYSATKAGVTGFVKGLRREVTARGVRVHGIHPGPVSTEWLVRGRGRAPGSDAEAPGRQSPGIAPERVADQIAGCLTTYWSRTVAVPRWMGLARLGEVTPVNRLLDMTMSRQTDRIRRLTQQMVDDRAPGTGGSTGSGDERDTSQRRDE